MGTMTLSDFRTEIKENLDNRDDLTDARLNRWINHTYQHLTHPAVHKFEDLATTINITLVSGTASYDLSDATTSAGRILAIRVASYLAAASGSIVDSTRRHRLKPLPIQRYDERQHTSGEPRFYTVGEDQAMLLDPTPNNTNTVRLRVWREAASLTNDTDTTVLPEYWDEVLLTGSQALTEFKLNYRDRANETFQLYNNFINNASDKSVLEAHNWDFEMQVISQPHMGVS